MKISPLLKQLQGYWRPIIIVHLCFTLLGIALLTPAFGAILQALVSLSGSAAVADQDIARLLLSPLGMLAGVFLTGLALAIAALELGALQGIAQSAQHAVPLKPLQAALYSLRHAPPLFLLTLWLTLRCLLYVLPVLGLIAGIAWLMLGAHDINYYLAQRPKEFYYAVAAGGVLGLGLAWLLGRKLLDWSLVLPLTLFGNIAPRLSFATSAQLTADNKHEVLRAFMTWLIVSASMLLVPPLFLAIATQWSFNAEHQALTPMLLVLGGTAVIWSILNFFASAFVAATFTFLVADIYHRLGPPLSKDLLIQELHEGEPANARHWNTRYILLGALAAAALALLAGKMLLGNVQLDDNVIVVAHRGAAGAAPENTLAAIRQAIDDKTDWVEIDVQETRDGQVVVVHDSDFMKLAGNPVKVWEADLATIQQIDIGSWFGAEFADQRVPTLAQVLEEIRGRSRLVIELKYYGHDQQLEQRVVDLVEAAGMEDDIVVMSLKLEGVQKIQALRPDWTAGLLAATAVGDLSRLDVDFLAVNANMAKPGFIRRAHKAGKQVFVWTINDALSLSRWMSMGVDGVITDEPALARRIMAERGELSSAERLLLSAGFFFGKPQVPAKYRDNSP